MSDLRRFLELVRDTKVELLSTVEQGEERWRNSGYNNMGSTKDELHDSSGLSWEGFGIWYEQLKQDGLIEEKDGFTGETIVRITAKV